MATYKIPFVLKSQGTAVVEARSEAEAEEKLEEMSFEQLYALATPQQELDLTIMSEDVFKLFD